jgi:hypothetical protein
VRKRIERVAPARACERFTATDSPAFPEHRDGQEVRIQRVSDAVLFKLFDVAKEVFNNHLVDVREMLVEMKEGRRRK